MKAAKPPRGFLTVKETAELFRVNPSTIYRLVARGQLHAIRIGRQLRFDAKELNQMARWERKTTRRSK
jgi:excisionase family DNA binding protein